MSGRSVWVLHEAEEVFVAARMRSKAIACTRVSAPDPAAIAQSRSWIVDPGHTSCQLAFVRVVLVNSDGRMIGGKRMLGLLKSVGRPHASFGRTPSGVDGSVEIMSDMHGQYGRRDAVAGRF